MVEVTNGQYADDDMGPIGDAAREIASYCGGPERVNVYRRAKVELAAAITEGRRQMREEAAGVVNAMRDEDSPDLDFRSIRDRISTILIGDVALDK